MNVNIIHVITYFITNLHSANYSMADKAGRFIVTIVKNCYSIYDRNTPTHADCMVTKVHDKNIENTESEAKAANQIYLVKWNERQIMTMACSNCVWHIPDTVSEQKACQYLC